MLFILYLSAILTIQFTRSKPSDDPVRVNPDREPTPIESERMRTLTVDTQETVSVPYMSETATLTDGYEWIRSLEKTPWTELGAWGRDGWDLGSWPYSVYATAETIDTVGPLYGYCSYTEGDISVHWYRSEEARTLAISKEAYWMWASGQADGPEALAGLDPNEFRRIDGLCEPYRPRS